MKERIDISYYAVGNRNFECIHKYPNLYKSTSSVRSTASNLMERNYLDFEPGILKKKERYIDIPKAKEFSKGPDIYYKYHPEYKYYHNTNEQNKILNNYLSPVNQYTYRESPMIKSAEQLLCIQKRKMNNESNENDQLFKITEKELNNKENIRYNEENPNQNKDQDKDCIPLKNPMNKNILVSNDYHLKTSTNAERRFKPPSNTPNMEDLKFGSFLESKQSPEYLRNYDKESLKNIDNYYINQKENLHILSRFGNWITLRPDDKNRSHSLEKLKHGTYETSIVAPVWMDIASRRNKNPVKINSRNKGYDHMEFNNKMFTKHEYNTSVRDKGRMTILQDKDQKNAKPIYLRDSYEKHRIIFEQEGKDLQNKNESQKYD